MKASRSATATTEASTAPDGQVIGAADQVHHAVQVGALFVLVVADIECCNETSSTRERSFMIKISGDHVVLRAFG